MRIKEDGLKHFGLRQGKEIFLSPKQDADYFLSLNSKALKDLLNFLKWFLIFWKDGLLKQFCDKSLISRWCQVCQTIKWIKADLEIVIIGFYLVLIVLYQLVL